MSKSSRTTIARFINVRAPQAIADSGLSAGRSVKPPKAFKSGLLKAAETGSAKTSEDMRKLAGKVVAETDAGLSGLALDDVIRAAVMPRGQNAKAAGELIEVRLGKKPADLVKDGHYVKRLAATWERLYALSLTGQDRRSESNLLRAAEVLDDIAEAKAADKAPTWSAALGWKVAVPKGLFLPPEAKEPAPDLRAKDLLEGAKALFGELTLLDRIERKARSADKQYYRKGKGAQTKLRELKGPVAAAADRKADREFAVLEDRVGRDPELKKVTEDLRARIKGMTPAHQAGVDVIEPENWLQEAMKGSGGMFSAPEQKFMSRYEAQVLAESEMDAIGAMRDDVYARTKALLYDPKHALPAAVLNAPEVKALVKQLNLPRHALGAAFSFGLTASLPRVHVLGVGDLIVVEEQTSRYELGEVAHIENVMATETRSRTHLRIAETEATTTTETEETAVDEKSLQTTTRFELSKETQAEIESSLQVTAGGSMSASYGPVSVSANMGVTSSTSASSGTNTASTLAREAVEKAVSKITKSVREEQILRVLNRVEETNEHGFANTTSQHISGIYRWVDKYVTVRAVNYGRRLMLEMIVPEPANGLIYAEEMHADEEILVEPPLFDIGPKDVTRSNYLDWAETYGAPDIPAPPKERIFQTMTYGNASPGKDSEFSETGKTLAIPDGYQTTNVWKSSWAIYYDDYIWDHLAANKHFPGADSVLEGVTGSLQLASNMKCASFMVGWKVRCELTLEAYQAWQVKAWAALKQASDAAQAAYLEALAAQAVGQGVHIEGRNPGQNKDIVRNELKRAAIRFLSNDMGELVVAGQTRVGEIFNAADSTGNFNLAEARIEGMIIQFFEQAFEWHNMTWLLYPYFWANSSRQHAKLLAEDHDPAMRDFYAAGAARVVVPVPVDYEDAVLNFFETNEIWNGGEPPQIDDPEYVSIAEELKQGRTNSFNTPIYYESAGTPPPFIIDEWEEKLPTSLVMLQADSALPKFPSGLFETDVAGLLDAAVQATGTGANWRNSIVDLLTLYGVQNADQEANRRGFAAGQGYPGDPDKDAVASVDSWSYFFVIGQINLNGLS
jgi:hypothetical protein